VPDLTSSVIQGFPIGCVFALVAVGFVLTYKVSGVFNLAFGAQAYAAAAFYYELRVNHGWPTPWAAVVAILIVSPLIGVLLYFAIYRHLRTAPPVAKLAVSIGLLVALPEIEADPALRRLAPVRRRGHRRQGRHAVEFFSYAVDRNQLATIIATFAVVVGLTLMFRYTDRLRMRWSSPHDRALGHQLRSRLSFGWALSSMLAGMAGVLLGPLFPQLAAELLPAHRRRDRGRRVRRTVESPARADRRARAGHR
jgi:branched-subunit amino acid ABC-type transport system permease component